MSRKEAKRLRKAAADTTKGGAETKAAPTPRDTSPYIHQDDRLDYALDIRERISLTPKQQDILSVSQERATRCVMIDGVWGTGKSYLVVLAALKLLNSGRVRKVLYVRNPVEASANSRLGYIPGTIEEKMAPYNAVLREKLEELLPKGQVDRLLKDGTVEGIPTGFLQGRSFNSTAIIVDEAASMSWEDLMLLVSRCGEFTRILFVGDTINQLYLRGESGFARFFRCFNDDDCRAHGIHAFELKEPGDIVRSGFVRYVMKKAGVIKE